MSFQIIKNSIATIPHIVRLVMLGMLVIFISLLFPTSVDFDYKFEQGKFWRYADLKAPFDFPIKKTAEEILAEESKIVNQMTPYYRWDRAVVEAQELQFVQLFSQKKDTYQFSTKTSNIDSAAYVNFGLEVIKQVYNKGLIGLKEGDAEKGETFVFELLDGNIDLGEYLIGDLLTHKKAIEFVLDTLSMVEKKLAESSFLLELFEETLERPNIIYDSLVTLKSNEDMLKNISPYMGMVKTGDPIIARGGLIDSVAFSKLSSYKAKYQQEINQNKNAFLVYLGYLILTIALIGIFAFFMHFNSPQVFENFQHLSLILSMIASYAYLAHLVEGVYLLDLYVIPFCIIPIIIINFFNAQLALFTHVVIVLLVSLLLSLDYQFILVQILVGMVAVITKLKTRHLSDFFVSLLYLGIAYAVGFLSIELIHSGTLFPILAENGSVIEEGVRWYILGWILFNVFLTLLSYPLIPLLEKFFGLTSDITLVELADLDNPLLKDLSFKAPGTLQHSLQVANLGEAAAKAIGANSLLVKTAALYHDIGKMNHPEYFIENQNHSNPHANLTCLESAQMIINHVPEGVKLAKKHRIPSILIDFIWTHHGTTRVEYFYRTQKINHPELEINPADFTYPGPIPSSKEQAILMMADSLEAASKSLKTPTEEDINNLVENIIQGKITMGQLQNTTLSFRELETIKVVFKQLLKSINHVRITYPGEDKGGVQH